jgi:hypothetical protein
VDCREDDAVEGRDGREEQGSCQASAPEPFGFSSQDAGCDEDIVSGKKRRVEVSISRAPSLFADGSMGAWIDEVENLQDP